MSKEAIEVIIDLIELGAMSSNKEIVKCLRTANSVSEPAPVQTTAAHITWNSDGVRTVNGVPDYTPPAAAQPAPVQEPVGIFWFNPQDKLWYQTLSYHDDDDDDRYQPLYAAAPQRKPLTDEEIITAYETSGHKQSIRPQDVFAVASLARAIEAAHGIKEKNI